MTIATNIVHPICQNIGNGISGGTSSGFNPASIVDADGNELLKQYLYGKTAMSGSTIFDERTNKGDARDVQLRYVNHLNGTTQYGLVLDDTTLDITNNLTVIAVAKNDKSSLAISENMAAKYDQGNNRRTWGFVQAAGETFGLNLGAADGTFLGRWESDDAVAVENKGFYAATFDSGVVKLNYEGSEVSGSATSGSIPSVINASTAPLTVGSALSNNGTANGFDGIIYELIIIRGDSAPLTQAQIADVYDSISAVPTKDIQDTVYGLSGQSVRAHYKLDENTGSAFFDSSGNENHGTWQNSPTIETNTDNVISYQNNVGYTNNSGLLVPRDESNITLDVQGNPLQFAGEVPYNGLAKQSNCLTFNGTNQYVQYDSALIPATSNFEIELQLKLSTVSGVRTFVSQYTGGVQGRFRFGVNANVLNLFIGGTGAVSFNGSINLSVGVAYNIKLRRTGTTFAMYVNDVLDESATSSIAVQQSANTTIGVGAGSLFISSEVDYFKIKDSSGNDIIYNTFSEGAGNLVTDVSGNGNIGTLVNSPTWSKQDAFHYNLAYGCNRYMWFDGVNDYVSVAGVTATANYFGACVISANVLVADSSQVGTVFALGAACYRLYTNTNWALNSSTDTGVAVTRGWHNVSVTFNASGEATSFRLNGAIVWTGTAPVGASPTTVFYIGGRDSDGVGLLWTGFISNVSITGSSVKNFSINGYGNTSADWLDQVGSNNGTVNGSPVNYYAPAVSETLDVFGSTILGTGNVYNGKRNWAETLTDKTGGVASPFAVQAGLPTAEAFNTTLTNPLFNRDRTKNGIVVITDQDWAFSKTLSGTNLTKVTSAEATKAI